MLCIQAALSGFTGSWEIFVFHTLSAGNIGQLGAPGTVVPVRVLEVAGADAADVADEDAADGDVVGCVERPAGLPALAAWCPGLGAAAVRGPAEQPAPAAAIAITAATAPALAARMVRLGGSGITVAS